MEVCTVKAISKVPVMHDDVKADKERQRLLSENEE
jgi:hypothetical protein